MIPEATKTGVLSVGRLYCDLIFTGVPRMPTLGTETFAEGLSFHAGGGAFITAAWLASLGHRSALASFLPPPPFDEKLSGEMTQAGINLALCRPSAPEQAPQLTVSISAGEDRAFLTHRHGAAFPDPGIEGIRKSGARHVHIGEASTLIESPGILSTARAAGATISLDCGWEDDIATADLARLLSDVDVFLPNEIEASRLRHLGVPLDAPGVTVIKRGAAGASAIDAGRDIHAPARAAKVVDTTGAGDAFNAGFLSAWLAGANIEACLHAGNAIGAQAVMQRGGFSAQTIAAAAAEIVAE